MNELAQVTRGLYVWVDVYRALQNIPAGSTAADTVERLAGAIAKSDMDNDVTSTLLAVAIHELAKSR